MAFDDPFDAPKHIRDAARRGELVIFVGAGASMLCGSPSWQDFAHGMIDQLAPHVGLDYAATLQLKSISDARRKASVAKEIWSGSGADIDFDTILHPKNSPKEAGVQLYQHLSRIGAVFVTTNYDRWLDDLLEDEPLGVTTSVEPVDPIESTTHKNKTYHLRQDLNIARLDEPGAVLHLHGSWLNPREMVISHSDYIKHYAHGHVDAFLRELFSRKTVLFLGYSMSDMEVLDYIVRTNPQTRDARHLLLFPFLSAERIQVQYLQGYFRNQCGITMLPYCIDEEGHRELVNVLESWAGQVEVREPHVVDKQRHIDNAIENASLEPYREAALTFVENDEALAAYFFARVYGKEWFDDFVRKGFFSPSSNPTPEPVEGEDGYVHIPHWQSLPYLERLSKECRFGIDDELVERILAIIQDVTAHSRSDNDRTWFFFAKCLGALPVQLVSLRVLIAVSQWFAGRFDATLFGHELAFTLLPRLLDDDSKDAAEKVCAIVDALCTLRPRTDSSGEDERDLHAAISDHWLSQLVTSSSKTIAHKAGSQCIPIILKHLSRALRKPEDDRYGYIWRPAIEDDITWVRQSEARDALVSFLRDALGVCSVVSAAEMMPILRTLLQSEYATYKRVALHAIDANFATLGEVFFDALNESWFCIEHQHELYILLKNNFGAFSKIQQERVIQLLTTLSRQWSDPNQAKIWDATIQRDWLSAVAGHGNDFADREFEQRVKEVGPPDTDVAQPYRTSIVAMDREPGPTTLEKLVAMESSELYDFVANFAPSGSVDQASDAGLANVLAEVVRLSPGKIFANAQRFQQLRPIFRQAFFEGVRARLTDNEELPWDSVLDLCDITLGSSELWDDYAVEAAGEKKSSASFLLLSVIDLFRAVFERPVLNVSRETIDGIQRAVCNLAERTTPLPDFNVEQVDESAFRSVHGRAIQILIVYGGWVTRHAEEPGGSRADGWHRIQPSLDRLAKRAVASANHEFHYISSRHLAQLYYLSSDWTLNCAPQLFPNNHVGLWKCAAAGFAGVVHFIEPLYRVLRAAGQIHRLADRNNASRQTVERTAQHIALAYLAGSEEFDDSQSPLRLAFDSNNAKRTIWFIWTRRAQLTNEQKHRVTALWGYLSTQVLGREDENKELLSQMNLFSAYIDELTPSTTVLWLQAAPYADVEHAAATVVSNLNRLVARSPNEVGQVFLAMLTRSLPTFDAVEIVQCVDQLYASGARDAADKICELYERKAPGMLRETYLKHTSTPQ